MNTKSIQNFILQSKRKFRIAAAVAEAWREARSQLMSAFLDRLHTQLTRKLKGWEPSREGIFFKTTAGYYITKPKWGESYWIGFECYPDGSTIDIGICWETDNIRKQSVVELLTALQKIYPSAKFTPVYQWVYATLQWPEPDWSKPDVLWKMHKDQEFVTALADQLLKIVDVSEHIIDRLVRNK
jgi:hypothetical protein